MRHKVLRGQTLLDISQIYFGDVSYFSRIAQVNGLGLTDELTVGAEIIVPEILVDSESKRIANYFQTRTNLPIATNSSQSIEEGIEAWAVEYDFIVS
jgi:hypothetical protein